MYIKYHGTVWEGLFFTFMKVAGMVNIKLRFTN